MLLFIDIETVAETNNYLIYKKKKIREERYCNEKEGTEEERYNNRAPIHAEFAKIVCINRLVGVAQIKLQFVNVNEYSHVNKYLGLALTTLCHSLSLGSHE